VFRAHRATAECDHVTAHVLDREGDATAQPVVVAAALALREQARALAERRGDALRLECRGERVPAVGREADAEALRGGDIDAAAGEIRARALARRADQLGAVVALRGGGRLAHAAEETGLAGVVALGDLDAALRGQRAHGLGEAQVFVLHQERERVPTTVAAEAVEDLPLRMDVEGGRLLVVEGAEALEAATGLAERDVTADEIDDVDAGSDRFDRLLGDPAHALASRVAGSTATL